MQYIHTLIDQMWYFPGTAFHQWWPLSCCVECPHVLQLVCELVHTAVHQRKLHSRSAGYAKWFGLLGMYTGILYMAHSLAHPLKAHSSLSVKVTAIYMYRTGHGWYMDIDIFISNGHSYKIKSGLLSQTGEHMHINTYSANIINTSAWIIREIM